MLFSPLWWCKVIAGLLAVVVLVHNSVYVSRWLRAGRYGPGLPSPIMLIGGICALIASGAHYFSGGSAWLFLFPVAVEVEWLLPLLLLPKRSA